jgi:hypothetical protein
MYEEGSIHKSCFVNLDDCILKEYKKKNLKTEEKFIDTVFNL